MCRLIGVTISIPVQREFVVCTDYYYKFFLYTGVNRDTVYLIRKTHKIFSNGYTKNQVSKRFRYLNV